MSECVADRSGVSVNSVLYSNRCDTGDAEHSSTELVQDLLPAVVWESKRVRRSLQTERWMYSNAVVGKTEHYILVTEVVVADSAECASCTRYYVLSVVSTGFLGSAAAVPSEQNELVTANSQTATQSAAAGWATCQLDSRATLPDNSVYITNTAPISTC